VKGYSADYADHPQLDVAYLNGIHGRMLDLDMPVYVLKAMTILDLAPPLDQECHPPNLIKTHFDSR
jgi:hypothetical protein